MRRWTQEKQVRVAASVQCRSRNTFYLLLFSLAQTVGHHVLTLDSSSTMALVQLEILSQIEEATGKRIPEIFEWIVASGIGAILLLAMIYCKATV